MKLDSINDLKAAPYNPRRIGDRAASGLSKSLESFGDIAGITWNKRTGHLVCGHQRVNQLKQQGGEFKNGHIVVGDLKYPVRIVDWDETKEKAANVAANNYRTGGEFTGKINDILDDLNNELGEHFISLGFDELALDLKVEVGEFDLDGLDLGDGDIKEKPSMIKVTIFLPTSDPTKKARLREFVEGIGGVVVG